MDTQQFDVAVIGGGIAGCTAAVLFARAGLSVALVERHALEAGYKQLCTHYIQPSATATIRRLGLETRLTAAGAIPNAIDMWTPWGWIDEPQLLDDHGEPVFGYNVRRQTLDPMLRALAQDTPGLSTFFGCSLVDVTLAGKRVDSLRIDGAEPRTLSARLYVAADGRNSRLAKAVGLAPRHTPNLRAGIFAQYRNLGLQRGKRSQAWFSGPDVAYIFPNEDDVTVVACMPNKARLAQFRDDPAAALEAYIETLDAHPDFVGAERISEAYVVKDYPNQTRQPTHGNVALIGDCALSMDPLFGVGCGWAFQSAAWLVDACGDALKDDKKTLAAGLRRYAARRKRELGGHVFVISDFSRRANFNLIERLMFSAATRDARLARHVNLFASRVTGLTKFLDPRAIARALWINLRHAVAPLTRPRTA